MHTPAPPSRPPRPRRYRGVDAKSRTSERRRQFVEAGLECFGTRGFHAVTVRELCAAAHLTERYFYESFKDREALFAAVYEHQIDELRREFLAAALPKVPHVLEMARAGLGVFFGRLKRDPRVGRLLLVEVLTVSAAMERRAQDATFGFADLIRQMTGPHAPTAPRGDLGLVATGLIGACVHIAMRWNADGYRQSLDEVTDAAMGFFEATARQLGAG